MVRPQPFRATIQVPTEICGRLLTDRVAWRRHTHMLEERRPQDARTSARKDQYRRNIVNLLVAAYAEADPFADHNATRALVQRFVTLAHTLETLKAVAFLFGEAQDIDAGGDVEVDNAAESVHTPAEESVNQATGAAQKPSREDILHPLLVALLAYQMGGPVNAAFTKHEHEWKVPDNVGNGAPNLYSEGDAGDMFDGFRVTVVWETQDGLRVGPLGTHNVFLTGDATPRPLVTQEPEAQSGAASPLTILYESGKAALYYDCEDPNAVRKSISFDFHLNSNMDDDIRQLTVPSDAVKVEDITMTKLVTGFPIENYTHHFHNLLFADASLNAILTKLSTLDVPPPPAVPDTTHHQIASRFALYKQDSIDHLPPVVRRMEQDIQLQGIYPTPASFLDAIVLKARRDIHLPIGMNLFPQSPLEENKECARKLLRDLPENLISTRLTSYALALVEPPYTANDLLPTRQLHHLAKIMEQRCLELIGIGFVDDGGRLPSIAALVAAFGEAVDGVKAIQIEPEPWVDEGDMQIYRSRCLYLFWCADWLVCYFVKPTSGPFMIVDAEKATDDIVRMRNEVVRVATALVRNWVAWGLFIEQLPPGGFNVRAPAGFGEGL
jgi:hypothetical protein